MKDYDFKGAEPKWAAYWDDLGIYRFVPSDSREIYSIDTPPPTVSGSLHIGHCFSYTHADVLARFWRMRGKNVFYPMGFDDNGLPTEKFVEQTHGIRAREMPRKEFVALCLRAVQEQEREFERLWRRLGLSVDWSRCYSTISPPAQKISQRSFLELYKEGRIYRKAAPTIWCPSCRTAIAQAELEDRTYAIAHTVNVHERCGTEIEFLVQPQWFLKILDLKAELLRAGEQIEWIPAFMGKRYQHWVENLKWDWCLSRQRFFGVPIPLWLCKNCQEIVPAQEEQLPVDPIQTSPAKPCPRCGSSNFEPERDLLDTWATSSLTPQINMRWGASDELQLLPMSVRPQAHEIIRTWAFYTIVKSLLHHKKIPWKRAQISGWVVTEQGKIGKSKGGGAQDPLVLIEEHSADALRYWACRGRPGHDTVYSEDVVAEGRRLMTKLLNATRFASVHLDNYAEPEKASLEAIDRWLLSKLARAISAATEHFEAGDYTGALAETERFFWRDLCDNYIEIIKRRLYQKEDGGSRRAVQYVLYHATLSVLKLLAPFVPFITEELYQAHFARREGAPSIHIACWPISELDWLNAEAEAQGDLAIAVIEAVRKEKSLKRLSLAAPIQELHVCARPALRAQLEPLLSAIRDVTNAEHVKLCETPTIEATATTGDVSVIIQ
jgi:valyl-tRNA synthetase